MPLMFQTLIFKIMEKNHPNHRSWARRLTGEQDLNLLIFGNTTSKQKAWKEGGRDQRRAQREEDDKKAFKHSFASFLPSIFITNAPSVMK